VTGVRRLGSVVEFDAAVGLGVVSVSVAGSEGSEGSEGGASYPFHCTQIADGSRQIPVGASVSFVVLAGRGGWWEAGDLRLS
jgi:CspA family cold shock protein